MLLWLWSWTNSAVIAPTQPGIEYTVPNNLIHYTVNDEDG